MSRFKGTVRLPSIVERVWVDHRRSLQMDTTAVQIHEQHKVMAVGRVVLC